MPQPDSSRSTHDRYKESNGTWPLDPAAPRRFGARMAARPGQQRSKDDPEKDGRLPQDPDGNEEQKREQQQPPSRRTSTERDSLATRSHSETESDTGSWIPQPFTLDDELDDTWPTVPTPYLDD